MFPGYLQRDGLLRCLMTALYAVVLAVALQPDARAQETGSGLKIAIIDTQKVLSSSTAMTQINRSIEDKRDALQNRFREKEQQLIRASRNLVQEKSVLDPSVFAQRKGDIDREAASVRKQAKELKAELNIIYANSVDLVRKEMNRIILERIKAQMFDLVVEKRATVFFRSDLEITDQIIEELNRVLPRVLEAPEQVQ